MSFLVIVRVILKEETYCHEVTDFAGYRVKAKDPLTAVNAALAQHQALFADYEVITDIECYIRHKGTWLLEGEWTGEMWGV